MRVCGVCYPPTGIEVLSLTRSAPAVVYIHTLVAEFIHTAVIALFIASLLVLRCSLLLSTLGRGPSSASGLAHCPWPALERVTPEQTRARQRCLVPLLLL